MVLWFYGTAENAAFLSFNRRKLVNKHTSAHLSKRSIGSRGPSIEIVALCLGNGGNSKDRDLDRELPFIFTETLGAWAAKEREHVVPRMYRTTASDSESGSDGEEEGDI